MWSKPSALMLQLKVNNLEIEFSASVFVLFCVLFSLHSFILFFLLFFFALKQIKQPPQHSILLSFVMASNVYKFYKNTIAGGRNVLSCKARNLFQNVWKKSEMGRLSCEIGDLELWQVLWNGKESSEKLVAHSFKDEALTCTPQYCIYISQIFLIELKQYLNPIYLPSKPHFLWARMVQELLFLPKIYKLVHTLPSPT